MTERAVERGSMAVEEESSSVGGGAGGDELCI